MSGRSSKVSLLLATQKLRVGLLNKHLAGKTLLVNDASRSRTSSPN